MCVADVMWKVTQKIDYPVITSETDVEWSDGVGITISFQVVSFLDLMDKNKRPT